MSNDFSNPSYPAMFPSSLNVGGGGGGGGGGGSGMLETGGYTTVTTAQQTFNPGNFIGTFTQTPVGDATDIVIEMDWVGPSPPNEGITNCAFSSFDTGISFTSFSKARLMSIVMEFNSVAGIGATGSANDNFVTGIYLSDKILSASGGVGTPGFRWGGEISRSVGPRPTHSFTYYWLRPFPATSLGTTGTVVAPAVVTSMATYPIMLPDGQLDFTFGNAQYNDGSGIANNNSQAEFPFGTPYNVAPAANMIIGCWFAMRNKPITPGTNYQMTYTLKYSVTDL